MSSGIKCKNCGSTDIEEDNARGDAVCTNCGSVLEDNIIVSEVQFEEGGHGAASAIGQFVSSDATGGATIYGKFQVGSGTESREVTIKRAKIGITHLCNQLQLSQHYIDTALNFFKMALMRHLTRGRKNSHIYAACVYITCRTEGTSHLLIDISDVLQICSYELGRTYLKLSNALCINIPSVDPCLYIMRFANKLQFDSKTHEVSMTALRIVQRMKKDSIHSGRRPIGICGAALLMAARMHEFNRTISDIVKIVKIHESTVRRRLTEFAETPSSALTFDEFMAVDLEAEQDPPAFKAARKKDRERMQKIGESELTSLQLEIDAQLEKDLRKTYKKGIRSLIDDYEATDTEKFVNESTNEIITEYLTDDPDIVNGTINRKVYIEGLKPDIVSMCTPTIRDYEKNDEENQNNDKQQEQNEELDLEGLDDDEINGYIMSEKEAYTKNLMWMKLNAEYLNNVKAREEKLAKEHEEGKPEKKKRKQRKKIIGPSNSAGEAIEKMLQEKKISSKINYEILKTLNEPKTDNTKSSETKSNDENNESVVEGNEKFEKQKEDNLSGDTRKSATITKIKHPNKRARLDVGLPVEQINTNINDDQEPIIETGDVCDISEDIDDIEPEAENETEPEYSSLKDMLNNGEDNDYYGYDDEQY